MHKGRSSVIITTELDRMSVASPEILEVLGASLRVSGRGEKEPKGPELGLFCDSVLPSICTSTQVARIL